MVFEGKEAKRNESMARARSNVIKTLATVAFFFIFCWTWNQTYYLMFYLDYPLIDFTSAFYNFTVIMVFLNCCVNPIIYSIKYEPVRRRVSHTKARWCCSKTSCARGDTICPRPSPLPVGAQAPRAPPSRRNVAVLSHVEYVPTLTAVAALRVKAPLSKAAW